tara:strand:+ start:57 stop:398 length:342 start_codon:yes stop_codon:yes gene_type:complete
MGRRDVIFDSLALTDAAQASRAVKVMNYITKLIFINCTDNADDMQFRVLGYFDSRDTTNSVRVILGWTFLDFGDTAIVKNTDPYDTIVVEAKNASAGNNSAVKAWLNCIGYDR